MRNDGSLRESPSAAKSRAPYSGEWAIGFSTLEKSKLGACKMVITSPGWVLSKFWYRSVMPL